MTGTFPIPACSVGWPEIIMSIAVILLLFVSKRLPAHARAICKSMKEFKKATKDVKKELTVDDDIDDDNPPYRTERKTQETPGERPSEKESSEK